MQSETCGCRPLAAQMNTCPERKQFTFTPRWENIRNWALKYINENRWRCDSIHEIDDLMQDAYLCFVKVRDRYPRVNSATHFMALFRTTLRNKLHDHSRYMQRKRGAINEVSVDVSECCANWMGADSNASFISTAVATAPDLVKRGISLVVNDHVSLYRRPANRRHRENLNMAISRALGATHFRFMDEIKAIVNK